LLWSLRLTSNSVNLFAHKDRKSIGKGLLKIRLGQNCLKIYILIVNVSVYKSNSSAEIYFQIKLLFRCEII